MLTTGWQSIANQSLIAMIGAMALNLLMGTTISLGHAGFIAAGAFTAAALVTHIDAPFALSLVAAAVVGGVIGVLVGFPALRLKGLYLAVSTLAAHFVDPTIIWIEHDTQLVRDLSDQVLVLHYGKALASGAPETALSDPRVIEAYLGSSKS